MVEEPEIVAPLGEAAAYALASLSAGPKGAGEVGRDVARRRT